MDASYLRFWKTYSWFFGWVHLPKNWVSSPLLKSCIHVLNNLNLRSLIEKMMNIFLPLWIKWNFLYDLFQLWGFSYYDGCDFTRNFRSFHFLYVAIREVKFVHFLKGKRRKSPPTEGLDLSIFWVYSSLTWHLKTLIHLISSMVGHGFLINFCVLLLFGILW